MPIMRYFYKTINKSGDEEPFTGYFQSRVAAGKWLAEWSKYWLKKGIKLKLVKINLTSRRK
jgi:hypothetical protein